MAKPTVKKRNYVNNEHFLQAMVAYKKAVREAEDSGEELPRIPNYIGLCFHDIATRLSYSHNFINYPYREDMVADGLENAVVAVHNFDPEKSSNPFGYFTQVIYFAFIRRIHKEKKQLYVRHKVLENSILMDTFIDSGKSADTDAVSFEGLLTNDYMVGFVERYEASMEKKKKPKVAKSGIENFVEEDPEGDE